MPHFVTGVYVVNLFNTIFVSTWAFYKWVDEESFKRNVLLTKRHVSRHEASVRIFSLPTRQSNIDVIYAPTGLKKHFTLMLKP